MEGNSFVLNKEYTDDDIKKLDEEETRKLIIELIDSNDLNNLEKSIETGDTIVRLINEERTIEVIKISKISFYDLIKENIKDKI